VIDLTGPWRAAVADDELRRRATQADFDDSSWESVTVPHHWRSTPAFADADGPLIYRRRFAAPQHPGATDRRWWLQFDGIFYQGDVWFDGTYLGDTEGYFAPHSFEVTHQLAAGSEHALSVEVTCAPQTSRKSKRNLTGVFQHWDCIDPKWNPGGIWRPVRLMSTGPIRIERLRVLCLEANDRQAVLAIRAVLDSDVARTVTLGTHVGNDSNGTEHAGEHSLASGTNRVEWKVTIERPALWWPHALGTPDLVDVEVSAVDNETGAVSDARRRRTGLRQVRQHDWVYEINGERIFLKGANQGPLRMALGESTTDEHRQLLTLARDAGLDFVRLHAHIGHPDVYDVADEMGMLVWQDLPLQWGYARSVRKAAVDQARDAVDLLGHHPSIIQWSGHNEPLALDIEAGESLDNRKRAVNMVGRFLAAQALPTWNKNVLDLAISRSLSKSDPSRPVSSHSGVLPGPFSGGSDTHLYFGWYHGNERDLPAWLARVPRLARFLSEFGAQAVPTGSGATFADPSKWPDLDWERLSSNHALQLSVIERFTPREGHSTFESWANATQAYQATVVRRHIEELRRLKYHPTGGFAMFSFSDALDHPAITWAIIGHDRTTKQAYQAVRDACQPVIVVADRLPATLTSGMSIELDVHVVNDLRHTLRDISVRAELTIGRDVAPLSWTWVGDCPADHVARIGSVPVNVPTSTAPGEPVTLRLVLTHADAAASNVYCASIGRGRLP
jgi:beta-mannosidase